MERLFPAAGTIDRGSLIQFGADPGKGGQINDGVVAHSFPHGDEGVQKRKGLGLPEEVNGFDSDQTEQFVDIAVGGREQQHPYAAYDRPGQEMRQGADGLYKLFVRGYPNLVKKDRQNDSGWEDEQVVQQNIQPVISKCTPEIVEGKDEFEVVKSYPALKSSNVEFTEGDDDTGQREIVENGNEQERWKYHQC